MTDAIAFYSGIAPSPSQKNDALSFDQVQGTGLLAPEDQLVPVRALPGLGDVTLTRAELADLARFWANEMSVFMQNGEAIPGTAGRPTQGFGGFSSLLGRRFAAFVQAAYASKKDLRGQSIGLGAGKSIYPQMLRPVTVYANGGSATETWVPASNPSAGWTAAYWTINLNKTSSTNSIQTQATITVLILGVGDWAAVPNIQELQMVDPGGAKYGVYTFPTSKMGGETFLKLFPEAFYIGQGVKWTIDVNFHAAAASIPVVIGNQFAQNVIATAE